jgi:hypothetical protein
MALPPAATTFSSSAEAFKYPLPTVRQFHKQLQSALDEKNARLRTLVGGSYRQLLGTAEMIVDMRRDIELAESKLAKVAEGCGRSAVGKRVAGLGKLGIARDVGGVREVDLGWLAKMKTLEGCVLVAGRLLKGKESSGLDSGRGRGERLIVAAKVWVLSRLLVKSLGDEAKNGEIGFEGGEELVEDMKRKLGALRRRLLRVVERMLEIDGDRDDLTLALCAYSLATSSGAKDVLRHFLHVRGEAMALAFEEDDEAPRKMKKEESILRALGLFTRTLLDTQALVPRQLSDALLALKGKPLVKDETIRQLEGLRLDISERGFGDEILFFTPYLRHDELDGSQAVEMLKGWAKRASEVLLGGFEKTLGRIMEFKAIVELRTKIFEAWISEGGKAKGYDPSVMLDGLRKVVNDRLVNLLEARIAKLHLVGTEVEAVLDSWAAGAMKTQTSLWNDELIEMELTGGAGDFKQAIISSVHGRSNSVSRVIKSHETWRHLVDELVTSIDQLRSQRWDNDIDSLEDDETLENRNTLLSKDDPLMLLEHMDTNLEQAYKALHQKIGTLLTTHKQSEHAGLVAVFIIRVLRDIRGALPMRPDLKSFGLSIIPNLHAILATSVSSAAILSLITTLAGRKRVVGRALWEGKPEFPIHPSPAAFKFLHDLTSSMATAGSDLWSPAAVAAIKRHLRDMLRQQLNPILNSIDTKGGVQANGHKSGESNGEGAEELPSSTEAEAEAETSQDAQADDNPRAGEAEQTTRRQEILVQSLFDILLLQYALQLANSVEETASTEDGLVQLEASIKSRLELPSSEAQKLQRRAQEYWKRTGLLFGLLA